MPGSDFFQAILGGIFADMTETGEKVQEKLSFSQILWVAMGGQM